MTNYTGLKMTGHSFNEDFYNDSLGNTYSRSKGKITKLKNPTKKQLRNTVRALPKLNSYTNF